MSLMSKKNADMIDTNSESNQELADLKSLEARRQFWSGKVEDVFSWKNENMLAYLSELMSIEKVELSEKFDFPSMADYKKHSFPKSTRLNVLPIAKLIYIEQATGKNFNELVLEMIDSQYEKARGEHKKG